ncbi:MAG: aminotransferase class III-fold pyridoxal phosphate-dependent enzyme [Lewinellaceae bacterium]|nr:aminotransferase class III-fold pyridoxal phosphate-dependent enzyme [Lewinellaceae bacterium]
MSFTSEQIAALALEHYHLEVSVTPLPGEIDLNFHVRTPSGEVFTLKIANPAERRENLEFQNALMLRLAATDIGLEVPQVIPARNGEHITAITAPDGARRLMRLLSWVEGRCFADVCPHSPELMERVGEMCGKLCVALSGFDHPAAQRFIKWDLAQTTWIRDHLAKITDPGKQALAAYFFQLYETEVLPQQDDLRQSVIYNDANDYNILVSHDLENPVVPGVIDFGDAVFSHTLNELAIAAAYVAMHKPDPLTAIFHLTRGFHRVFPLTGQEAAVLFPLISARLLISVTCSAINLAENPGNEYLQISDRPAWALLEKLRTIAPALALATIRHACGWEPCPRNEDFKRWAKDNFQQIKPVVAADLSKAVWLDLGAGSPDLGNYAGIENANQLDRIITGMMDGRVGIGRYDEVRSFYTTDAYEVHGNEGPEWRSVHIGLDIFMPPGTPVSAPFDAVVHSFQDNANDRDYGPTILLEHQVSDGLRFFTLYGHLTRASLEGLKVGQSITAGQVFCQIGPMPENGNWSPHLHFQVMLDTLGMEGDFPGVAFPGKRDIWKSLCPDPWLLLTGENSPKTGESLPEEILKYRHAHLGKNLSVSYRKPLKMVRGWRQYLMDDTGRRYLDTVNNVAHVGHEHPRVVRAGQRQMAVLNTNTRYLHDNIVHFTAELLQTFPPGLDVAFLVNSGSEANELAMRLAKNYTGQKDMVVVEVGYHGNTQGCVEISSYKFDGPGGKGAPPYIHVTPIPDVFRGKYRGNTVETGRQYAAQVSAAVEKIRTEGRRPAAFICESVISCGGQVTLPPGYLTESVQALRAAGGLYIADEVQTGCGRHGQYFWAFEEHGVVPDIVTVGKPIGNGHPLGVVVTTRAIADAFANGMEYFNTFGGNPVSCAIGLEVLRVIREEGLQQNARETGAYLQGLLKDMAHRFPVIGDVRGPGLFLGFELINNPETLEPAADKTAYLANRMRDLGVLMSTDGPYHNVLKIKPPMVFGRRDADFFAEMLEKVLKEDFMR